MQTMAESGVLVRFQSATKVARVDLSFDGNDDYAIEFRRGTHSLGNVRSRSLQLIGVHTRKVEVPRTAAMTGFDRIFVRPLNGDRAYSVGFIRPRL